MDQLNAAVKWRLFRQVALPYDDIPPFNPGLVNHSSMRQCCATQVENTHTHRRDSSTTRQCASVAQPTSRTHIPTDGRYLLLPRHHQRRFSQRPPLQPCTTCWCSVHYGDRLHLQQLEISLFQYWTKSGFC